MTARHFTGEPCACKSPNPFCACSPKAARWSRWPLRSRCWSGSSGRRPRSFSISAARRSGRRRAATAAVGGWFGGDLFAPFQQQHQQAPKRVENFSKAPPPEKRDNAIVPERNVLVLGDAMADWLAYGLEDAYSEQPDMGVIRKHKTVSGLIKYQPKGEPADWAAAAKGILATEKPDAIVVMLGLNDRIAMREPAADKSDGKATDKKSARRPSPDAPHKPDGASDAAAKPDAKPADTEAADDAADNDTPAIIAPEKSTRAPNGLYEFREERWVELYSQEDR